MSYPGLTPIYQHFPHTRHETNSKIDSMLLLLLLLTLGRNVAQGV